MGTYVEPVPSGGGRNGGYIILLTPGAIEAANILGYPVIDYSYEERPVKIVMVPEGSDTYGFCGPIGSKAKNIEARKKKRPGERFR